MCVVGLKIVYYQKDNLQFLPWFFLSNKEGQYAKAKISYSLSYIVLISIAKPAVHTNPFRSLPKSASKPENSLENAGVAF